MNIFKIVAAELKINFRDKKAMTPMVLFPIVLIMILGIVFSGTFKNSTGLKNQTVFYRIEGNNGTVIDAFNEFIKQSEKAGIKFSEVKDKQQGLYSVRNNKCSGYMEIDSNNNKVVLYKNDWSHLGASVVEVILNTFVQRYNAVFEIARLNPQYLKNLNSNNSDYVKIISVDGKRQPSARDYYGVTMLTLIILYASLTGAWSIKHEKIKKTGKRMLCSPMKKYEMLTGKLIGTVLVTIIQIFIVILFSKYILRVYWGQNFAVILGIIISEIVMAVSIGVGVGIIIKNENAMSGILNIFIPFIVFFGGGYVPLSNFNSPIINLISKASPLKWTNDAIFKVIYGGSFKYVPEALLFNLATAVVFITVSSILFREEVLL